MDLEKLKRLIEQGDSAKTIIMKMECTHRTVKKYAAIISEEHLKMLVQNGKDQIIKSRKQNRFAAF